VSSWHLPARLDADISKRHSGAAYSLTECRSEESTTMRMAPAAVNSALNKLMLCLMRLQHIPKCTQNFGGIHNFTNVVRVLRNTWVSGYLALKRIPGYPFRALVKRMASPTLSSGYRILATGFGSRGRSAQESWVTVIWGPQYRQRRQEFTERGLLNKLRQLKPLTSPCI